MSKEITRLEIIMGDKFPFTCRYKVIIYYTDGSQNRKTLSGLTLVSNEYWKHIPLWGKKHMTYIKDLVLLDRPDDLMYRDFLKECKVL